MTEYEIAAGMPTTQDCEKHCIGMLRTIDDLDHHLDEPAVAKFVDLIPGTSLIDDEAQGLLNALRDEKIPRFVMQIIKVRFPLIPLHVNVNSESESQMISIVKHSLAVCIY